MADIVNQAQTKVTVDSKQAADELTSLEKKAQKYRDAMVAANKAGDVKGYDKAQKGLKGVDKEMRNVLRSSYDVNKVLNNLSTAGPKQLRQALAQLYKDLNSGRVARGTKEWDEYQRKIRSVRTEIEKLNAEQGVSRSPWEKMVGGFNKYFALIGTFAASITGLSFAFRKLAEDVAKMDDVYSDVMKTTGMTREQVIDLNEEFKKMDTRTSRESLNNLARDAGKLGLQSKEDIMQFVDAANKVNVALGEDLGEDAMKNLGKLTDVYKASTKELDRLDLNGKILSIGSAINELGASSTASEPYMLDFSKRLGGVAAQAGISIQNVLGFASALDQSGQAVEMSATAFQNFIMKLMADPAKFAKLAGLEVKSFTDLLKNDTNEAIKQVLTALSNKGGFQALIPVFKDMGLDGARAVGVLSALATNINKVDEAQKIANRAFSENVSITNEYNTKNNNLQASLEKARKSFKDSALELGERLSPALLTSTNAMTYMVKALPGVIDWFSKYKGLLITVITTLIAYTVAMNATTVAMKAKAVATDILNSKTIAFFKTLLTNPYTAIGVAIAAVVAGIYQLATYTTKAQEAINKFNAEARQQETELNGVFNAYKRANEGTEEKKKLLDIIKSKYGDYIRGLIDEKGRLIDVEYAQEQANKALRESIALKIRNNAINEVASEEIQKQSEYLGKLRNILAKTEGDEGANQIISRIGDIFNDESKDAVKAAQDARKYIEDAGISVVGTSMQAYLTKMARSVRTLRDETKKIKQSFTGLISDATEIDIYMPGAPDDNGKKPDAPTNPDKTDKAAAQRKKMQDALRSLEIKNNEEETKIHKKFRDGQIVSESEYNALLLQQQTDYDEARKKKLKELLDKNILVEKSLREEAQKQITDIDNKGLQREIKRQSDLKKILLSADPAAAEKEDYENRLRELGLFGVDREKLTKDQLSALELLEKQHKERVDKIERPEVMKKLKGLNEDQAADENKLAEDRTKTLMSEQRYRQQLLLIDIAYTTKKLQLEGLTEEQRIQLQRESLEKQRQLYDINADIQERLNKNKKPEDLAISKQKELDFLNQLGISNTEAYEQARLAIIQKYALLEEEENKLKLQRMQEASMFAMESMQTLMNSYSSYVQASNEAETAAINKKYEAEIKAAGSNSKKVKKLEEQRDKELKEANREAQERTFAIQIAMALASTAQSAINAYSSTAAIPIIGPGLAPIAAGVATAAGLLQVATIKKQHEAAMAQYYTGGFTPPGGKYEVAGYVHRDEFVANKETRNNPVARPLLEVIDHAQKNNSVSSLKASDFATALEYKERVALLPYQSRTAREAEEQQQNDYLLSVMGEMTEVVSRLKDRLDEPFVTVNTATGDKGIKQALALVDKMDKNAKRQ